MRCWRNPISSIRFWWFEVFIDKIVALYGSDEVFYRAAFLGGERLGLFEHEMSDGIFAKSIRVAERLCQRALDRGYLLGRIDPGFARTAIVWRTALAPAGLGERLYRPCDVSAAGAHWNAADICGRCDASTPCAHLRG